MVVRRKKKLRRQRGGRAHGWGIQKDHKGSGMRGGFGNAGVTQHHWIRTILEAKNKYSKDKFSKRIIGKYGFKRPQEFMKKYGTINVSHLDQSIDTLVSRGKATEDKGVYTVNLADLGYTKLLSQGNITRKMKITVERATDKAVAKVEAAGGSVTLLNKNED